jgi:hypothetical protein
MGNLNAFPQGNKSVAFMLNIILAKSDTAGTVSRASLSIQPQIDFKYSVNAASKTRLPASAALALTLPDFQPDRQRGVRAHARADAAETRTWIA